MGRRTMIAHPYGMTIRFALSQREADRLGKRYNIDTAGAAGWTIITNGVCLLAVCDGKQSTLVHECIHAAVEILTRVGIDPLSNDAEPLTYLSEYIFEHISRELARTAQNRP